MKRLSMKRLSMKRLSMKRLSMKRLSMKRLSMKRLSMKRLSMKRLRYNKTLVSAILANTFLFTWCLLIVFAVTGQEPAYLIEWYYKIVVGELGLMALIKLLETWRDKNDVDRDSGECDNTDDIDDSYLQDTASGGTFPER